MLIFCVRKGLGKIAVETYSLSGSDEKLESSAYLCFPYLLLHVTDTERRLTDSLVTPHTRLAAKECISLKYF
jgi:hypothetical protein